MDPTDCPACKLDHCVAPSIARSPYTGPSDAYRIRVCPTCGLGRTFPQPDAAELLGIYANAYDYSWYRWLRSEKRWRARQLLKLVRDEPVESVLDVGCMHGFLLEETKRQGARRIEGVEWLESPARAANALGLTVYKGSLQQYAATEPELFDLVIAQHVLEHVSDINEFFRTAFALVKPDGLLIISAPHFGSRSQRLLRRSWGWYLVPIHLNHFSAKSLQFLGSNHGAKPEKLVVRGGDSGFLALTTLNLMKTRLKPRIFRSTLVAAIIRIVAFVWRPYYFVGDEEIVAVFRSPER